MTALQPNFSPPGRTTFVNKHLVEEITSLQHLLKEKLGKIEHFCLSFDGWSSLAIRGYLGIVAHGIDDSWKLQTFLLTLKRVTKGESAEYITALTEEVDKHWCYSILTYIQTLKEWGMPKSSIVGVVTDGASNMRCAVVKFLGLRWLYCVAHMLNRAIQKAIDGTSLRKVVLKPAKKIARYFRSSNKAALEVLITELLLTTNTYLV